MDLKQTLAGIGVERLSGMQSEAYNLIAGTDKDVVVISPTGTGKTLAYMLPLAEILDPAADSLQAVVVVPGRELAMQSAAVMASLRTGVRTVCCYGGRPAMDEHRIIKDVRPQVVFGTPGRLNDHIAKGNLSPYSVRVAIVDEFDKCMEMGFQNEMSKLFKSLAGLRRRFLLSATDMEQIPGFVNIRSAVKLDYSAGGVSSRVSQYVVRSELKDKLQALDRLHMGGILADDMGLGKTLQVIALLLWAKRRGDDARPSIVVAPTSLVYNWMAEIARFAPELRVAAGEGAQE